MCIPCCAVNSVWVMGVCETHGLRAGDRDVHSLLWCEQCVGDGGVCVAAIVEVMYDWVKDGSAALPHHLLRFMTHLVLFLSRVGQATSVSGLTVTVVG